MSDFTRPRPRDVAGFADAQAAGRTPARPTSPPTPAGDTARAKFRRLAVVASVGIVVTVVAVLLMPKAPDGSLTWANVAVLLTLTGVGAVAVGRGVVSFRRVLLGEFQAGYTTVTFEQGKFWVGSTGVAGDVVGWDWSGTWVLDGDGNVKSEADFDVDPPGLYPSPHEEGRFELWTGHRWTRFYAD